MTIENQIKSAQRDQALIACDILLDMYVQGDIDKGSFIKIFAKFAEVAKELYTALNAYITRSSTGS